ncbi:unnamed protein product [Ixodes hexagonus]
MKTPATMEQVPPSQEQGKSPSPNENPPSQEMTSTHPTTHSHVQAEAVIPIKRQRVEDARRLDPKRLDPPSEGATSTYSLEEGMDDDDDDAGFTIVFYKKNRPAGIPILFHPTSREISFWKVNPNVLAKEVLGIAQEKILSHRIAKDGSLSVSVASLPAANKLLAQTSLAGIEVRATTPRSYSENMAKIKGVPLQYSDVDLLEYLKDNGVLAVQRQVAYQRQENGTSVATPKDSVILRFTQDRPMPPRVYLGFTSHPVEEYFGSPIQCYQCQRFGHIGKNCRGARRCKICAGPHHHQDCSSRAQPKCANCGENHAATFSGCSSKKAAAVVRKTEILNGRTPTRRSPPSNPEIVRIPETSSDAKSSTSKPTYSDVLHRRPSKKNTVSKKENGPTTSAPLGRSEKRESGTPMPTASVARRAPRPTASQVTPSSETPSATYRAESQVNENRQVTDQQFLIRLLFLAVKAIIRSLPDTANISEVKAILTMEPLILGTGVPEM